jgi:hypothetical protein
MSALPSGKNATAVGAEVPTRTRSADGEPSRSGGHDFHFPPPQLFEVMCECGNSACTGEITISLDEYEAVRLHPTRFLIKEGHEVADAFRVVDYGTGYIVVATYQQDAFSGRDFL